MITQDDLRRAIEGDDIPTNGKPFSSERVYRWTAEICLAWMVQHNLQERLHVGPFGAVERWERGDEVVLARGAEIWIEFPRTSHVLKRRQKIKVHNFHPGAAWEDKGPVMYHPRIVYVGTGGYYREVEPSQIEMRLQTLHDHLDYRARVA